MNWINANRKFLVAIVGAIVAAIAAAVKKPIDDATTQAIVGGIVAIVVWAVPNTPPATVAAKKSPSSPPVIGAALLALILGACAAAGREAKTDTNAACDIIQALDSNGTVHQVCAVAEDIAGIVSIVTAERASEADAGGRVSVVMPAQCRTIPSTNVCATDRELVAAIDRVKAKHAGGAK